MAALPLRLLARAGASFLELQLQEDAGQNGSSNVMGMFRFERLDDLHIENKSRTPRFADRISAR
jgi:hypothetical protein